MTTNTYPVFAPDQVLTDQHLNDLFTYLDEQDRISRTRLSGIGIVCGLELTIDAESVTVSKGCGITSLGYLLTFDTATFTHVKPYKPKARQDITPYKNFSLQQLSKSGTSIKDNPGVLKDQVVILFLEIEEVALKNCVENDCEDKGYKATLTVKPLLVPKAQLDTFLLTQTGYIDLMTLASGMNSTLKHIPIKRFNVPFSSLTTSAAVVNAFSKTVDDDVLQEIQTAYTNSYTVARNLLGYEEASDPFSGLKATLISRRDYIAENIPQFIQYYCDFADDLIKAYHEFKEKLSDYLSLCCPEDTYFPYHLMLGEAKAGKTKVTKSLYRQFFIYSPLFQNRIAAEEELRSLFLRMILLVKRALPDGLETLTTVKITPSSLGTQPLSNRAIPYYYDPSGLQKVWNYRLAALGRTDEILSYHASSYSSLDWVKNPLLYDHEPNNFYRIEGHTGQSYKIALNQITSIQEEMNLPFDIVAVTTGSNANNLPVNLTCSFQDLETNFRLLREELYSDLGDAAAFFAGEHMPSAASLLTETKTEVVVLKKVLDGITSTESLTGTSIFFRGLIANLKQAIKQQASDNRLDTFTDNYNKGLLLLLQPNAGAIADRLTNTGMYYLIVTDAAQISLSPAFEATEAQPNFEENNLKMLDLIETMGEVLGASDIASFDYDRFAELNEELKNYALQYETFIEKLAAAYRHAEQSKLTCLTRLIELPAIQKIQSLLEEYDNRTAKVQELLLLKNYAASHRGLEHKAGVPKGGTFVLVYHTKQKVRFPGKKTRTLSPSSKSLPRLSGASGTSPLLENIRSLIAGAAKDDIVKAGLDKFDFGSLFGGNDGFNPTITDTFPLADGTVFADFYLPYLCCSDCPPTDIGFAQPEAATVPYELAYTENICYTETFNLEENFADYTILQINDAGGLPITNFKIDFSTVSDITDNKTYTIKFTATKANRDFNITLNLVVNKPNSNFSASFDKGKDMLNLKAVLQSADYRYMWSIQHTGSPSGVNLAETTANASITMSSNALLGGEVKSIRLEVISKTSKCSNTTVLTLSKLLITKLTSGEQIKTQ